MAVTHNFVKELHRLGRTINKLTCGQARLEITDDEERTFYFYITPDDGYYKGSTCKFKVHVSEEYPEEPPLVRCLNKIYHPNIEFRTVSIESAVCVNLLDADWQPGVGLDGCVMALLYLFHNPVFPGSQMDEQEFEENVRKSLKGEEVVGFVFDKLINEEPDLVTNVQMNNNSNNEDETLNNNNESNIEQITFAVNKNTGYSLLQKLQFPKFAFLYSQIWHRILTVLLRLCRHFEHLHES